MKLHNVYFVELPAYFFLEKAIILSTVDRKELPMFS